MGTSRNDRSPDTPPWRLTLASLGAGAVPADRQASEIWRAAVADRADKLFKDFGAPVLAEASQLVGKRLSTPQTIQAFDDVTRQSRATGLAVEMARRALARASASEVGATGFAAELFAEATSYYASRDLPSVVGLPGRVETASAVIALKEQLRSAARNAVQRCRQPAPGPQAWRRFVETVIKELQGHGRRRS